jgi:hypothetical protein
LFAGAGAPCSSDVIFVTEPIGDFFGGGEALLVVIGAKVDGDWFDSFTFGVILFAADLE